MPKGLTHECKDDCSCYQLCTLVTGFSLQFPIHANISSAFVLAEITHMFMSLQDGMTAPRTSLHVAVKGRSGLLLFVVVPISL